MLNDSKASPASVSIEIGILSQRPIFGTKSGVTPALLPLVCCYKLRKPQREGINMRLGVLSDSKHKSGEGEWLMPSLTITLITSGKK